MITQEKDMILITVFKAILKLSLGWFGIVALAQNLINQDLFEQLIETMPSQIAFFLGFIYLVAIVFRKVSDSWTHHIMNRLKVKKEKERLEQEKIHTDSDLKNLNKKL